MVYHLYYTKYNKYNNHCALWVIVISQAQSFCRVERCKARIQVSRMKLHTHMHLYQVRVEFLSCIKKNKSKK